MNNESSGERTLTIHGGAYLNKGGTAIVHGTFKVLKELGIDFRYIVDPEPFPIEFFTSYNLTPIYRYSDVLWKKPIPSIGYISTFKPFIKCLINSYTPQIRRLHGSPIWHIGDSPFSDYRSRLSVIGQVIDLQSLKAVINGKLIIGGISLGFPRTKTGELVLRQFFKSVDYFFIRGSETYNTLRRLGIPHEKISIICDFAFHLDKKGGNESNKYSKFIEEAGKPTIALILREYSYGHHRENYIKAIRKLVSKLLEYDYKVFFIPTSYEFLIPENDKIFLEKVLNAEHRQIINIKDFSPEEIISVFSNFDVVISARLHGAIYGALANVPTIHLYEDRKSLEVIKDIFRETLPLIKLADFAEGNGLNEIFKITRYSLWKKDEISSEMKSHIKSVRESSINELKYSLEEKHLLE